jgi:hypothetical protein
MPRYFFDTEDGARSEDDEGMELPSRDAARVQAIRYAGMVLSGDPAILWKGDTFKVEVRNETGSRLFTVVSYAIDDPPAEAA